jgi:hypothetical protein
MPKRSVRLVAGFKIWLLNIEWILDAHFLWESVRPAPTVMFYIGYEPSLGYGCASWGRNANRPVSPVLSTRFCAFAPGKVLPNFVPSALNLLVMLAAILTNLCIGSNNDDAIPPPSRLPLLPGILAVKGRR